MTKHLEQSEIESGAIRIRAGTNWLAIERLTQGLADYQPPTDIASGQAARDDDTHTNTDEDINA